MCTIRDIKYMDWKRFRNLRVPENHPVYSVLPLLPQGRIEGGGGGGGGVATPFLPKILFFFPTPKNFTLHTAAASARISITCK